MTVSGTRVLLALFMLFVFGLVASGAVHAGYVTTIRGIDDITQRAEREHDRANRLTNVTPPTGPAQTLVYDHAGNLIRRSIGGDTIHYQWDAWNRLVEVRREDAQQTMTVLSRAVYDGEHRRVIRDVNTTGSGDPDERRRIYYDDAWRMIQEDVSDWNSGTPGWNAPHTQVNWYWGLRGTNDIVQRTERDLTQSGDPIAKQRWYVTDLDSSVVATVSQTGMIVERVSYSPFGEVRLHPLGDLDGDGAVNVSDQWLLLGNWGNAGIGDLNQDGVVDFQDIALLTGQWTSTPHPAGTLSTDGNTIGFTAHIYDVESGLLLARFRVYDAQLGRWLSPDPAGFVDGMNLYLYVRGNPLLWWDPLGLSAWSRWWRDLREGAAALVTGDTGVSGWQASDRAMLERHRALAQSDDSITRASAERMIASVEQGLSEVGDAVTDFQQARVDAAVTILTAPVTGTAALAIHTAHACGNAAVDIWQGQYGNAMLNIVPGAAGSAAPAIRNVAAGPVMAMLQRSGRQADEVIDGARGARHTSDQRALKDLVHEASAGGRRPLSRADAETVLDWASDVQYRGVRASPGDLASPSNWTANPVPHIHFPGVGRSGHVPVEAGVKPR